MKISTNCKSKKTDCPFLRSPLFKSGFTGRSGPDTYYRCVRTNEYIRNIKNCDLANNPEKQKWADILIKQAKDLNIPVWMKDNYGYPERIKEFPKGENHE